MDLLVLSFFNKKLGTDADSISSEQKQCALSNSFHLAKLNPRLSNSICFLDEVIQYEFSIVCFSPNEQLVNVSLSHLYMNCCNHILSTCVASFSHE